MSAITKSKDGMRYAVLDPDGKNLVVDAPTPDAALEKVVIGNTLEMAYTNGMLRSSMEVWGDKDTVTVWHGIDDTTIEFPTEELRRVLTGKLSAWGEQ